MLFLAHMLNRPVVDAAGTRLGWVEDLALTSLELFPRVAAIVLARRGQGAAVIPWEAVERADDRVVRLRALRENVPTIPLHEEAVFLRRDILDKQVVDINGRRVVRVNDLQLAPIDRDLRLVGADIGARGLLRRLSLEQPVSAMARTVRATLPERVIPWNYVEGLETEWPSVRLSVTHRRLRELPATDLADIVAQLHPEQREELLLAIDDEILAGALPHLQDEMQADVIEAMSDERASDIIEMLPPDEAADVLGDISEERAERILELMEPEEAEDVRALLRYGDETAGGRMTTEFLAFAQEMTVAQALAALRQHPPDAEAVYYLYVTGAAGHLEGVLSLRDMITVADDTPLSELARREVIRATVDDDQETVAHLLTHYHLQAVPVVDSDNVLRGVVSADDVLDVLHEEAGEDLSRLAGAVEETEVLATPWRQAWLRLPWLLGATLAGMLVAFYLAPRGGDMVGRMLSLLALLPLLLLLGVQLGGQGAATTQVVIGEGGALRDVLLRHLRYTWPAGLALALLAAIVGGVTTGWIGAASRPVAAGAAVWLVLMVDMLVGSLLPLLLRRLRLDPVLVSRPSLAVLALLLGVPLLTRAL